MGTGLLGGKYALDRRLGGGGMAEVFLGYAVGAEGFKRPVAIKRVLAGYSNDSRFAQMFVSEAQLSSRLQHPNIVNVLDFDRDDEGRLFLVMELVDGPTLDELGATGFLPYSAVAHVIAEVLRGLGYAHELPTVHDGVRGVVHRDISPHNVLLSWEGSVKVSDFGIAKARAASNASASETIKGKPAYMSPEQANGERLDGRSDLFAAGIMMWELLGARALFSGQSTQETLARLLFAPIASPRELRPDVPEDLERVVMRLLARKREDRYETAEAALADLVACAAYPRGGRDDLMALLAERFPGRAPERTLVSGNVPTIVPPPKAGDLPRPLDARPTDLTASLRGSGGVVAKPVPAVAERTRSPHRLSPIAAVALAAAAGGGVVWFATRSKPAPVAAPARGDANGASVVDAGVANTGGAAVDASLASGGAVVDAALASGGAVVDAAVANTSTSDAGVARAVLDASPARGASLDPPAARPKPPSFHSLAPAKRPRADDYPNWPAQPDPAAMFAAMQRVQKLGAKYCPAWYTDINVDGRFKFDEYGIITSISDVTPPDLAACVSKVVQATNFPVSKEGGEIRGLGLGLNKRP